MVVRGHATRWRRVSLVPSSWLPPPALPVPARRHLYVGAELAAAARARDAKLLEALTPAALLKGKRIDLDALQVAVACCSDFSQYQRLVGLFDEVVAAVPALVVPSQAVRVMLFAAARFGDFERMLGIYWTSLALSGSDPAAVRRDCAAVLVRGARDVADLERVYDALQGSQAAGASAAEAPSGASAAHAGYAAFPAVPFNKFAGLFRLSLDHGRGDLATAAVRAWVAAHGETGRGHAFALVRNMCIAPACAALDAHLSRQRQPATFFFKRLLGQGGAGNAAALLVENGRHPLITPGGLRQHVIDVIVEAIAAPSAMCPRGAPPGPALAALGFPSSTGSAAPPTGALDVASFVGFDRILATVEAAVAGGTAAAPATAAAPVGSGAADLASAVAAAPFSFTPEELSAAAAGYKDQSHWRQVLRARTQALLQTSFGSRQPSVSAVKASLREAMLVLAAGTRGGGSAYSVDPATSLALLLALEALTAAAVSGFPSPAPTSEFVLHDADLLPTPLRHSAGGRHSLSSPHHHPTPALPPALLVAAAAEAVRCCSAGRGWTTTAEAACLLSVASTAAGAAGAEAAAGGAGKPRPVARGTGSSKTGSGASGFMPWAAGTAAALRQLLQPLDAPFRVDWGAPEGSSGAEEQQQQQQQPPQSERVSRPASVAAGAAPPLSFAASSADPSLDLLLGMMGQVVGEAAGGLPGAPSSPLQQQQLSLLPPLWDATLPLPSHLRPAVALFDDVVMGEDEGPLPPPKEETRLDIRARARQRGGFQTGVHCGPFPHPLLDAEAAALWRLPQDPYLRGVLGQTLKASQLARLPPATLAALVAATEVLLCPAPPAGAQGASSPQPDAAAPAKAVLAGVKRGGGTPHDPALALAVASLA